MHAAFHGCCQVECPPPKRVLKGLREKIQVCPDEGLKRTDIGHHPVTGHLGVCMWVATLEITNIGSKAVCYPLMKGGGLGKPLRETDVLGWDPKLSRGCQLYLGVVLYRWQESSQGEPCIKFEGNCVIELQEGSPVEGTYEIIDVDIGCEREIHHGDCMGMVRVGGSKRKMPIPKEVEAFRGIFEEAIKEEQEFIHKQRERKAISSEYAAIHVSSIGGAVIPRPRSLMYCNFWRPGQTPLFTEKYALKLLQDLPPHRLRS